MTYEASAAKSRNRRKASAIAVCEVASQLANRVRFCRESNVQPRELIRVASPRTTPTSNSMMPTIDQASQFGIKIENHLTAPTARKAIPRTAMVIPANANTTMRSALLTNRSALLATPSRIRPRNSWISLSTKVDLSRSGNEYRLIACFRERYP